MPYLGYLVANLTIASNLRYADELAAIEEVRELLARRLEALGWRLAGQSWGEGLITPDGKWHDWPGDLGPFIAKLESEASS